MIEKIDKQYKDLLIDILENGIDVPDRTGVGRRRVFGRQIRLDLQQGFPLLTLKHTSFKITASELLWFIRGDTNNKWLKQQNVNIWNEWGNEDGDLFDIYSKQLRRWETGGNQWGLIERRSAVDDGKPESIRKFPDREADLNHSGIMTGQIHTNRRGQRFKVLEYLPKFKYNVQFLDTGYETIMDSPNIKPGNVRDPFFPQLDGVGYIGASRNGHPVKTKKQARAYSLWRAMIERCYDKKSKNYYKYGEKGITICKRWHNFQNYLSDLSTLPNYENWLRSPSDFNLDKDYYGANQYGPTTCVFLSKEHNNLLSNSIPVKYGDRIFPSIAQCADFLEISYHMLAPGLRKNGSFMGVSYYSPPDGLLYRPIIIVDQLKRLIKGIKENPLSSRHVISYWNAKDVETAALPPCHSFVNFYVECKEGVQLLNCHIVQRSADCYLGLPTNLASYSLLTHMIAHLTNMIPGEVLWTGTDVHLYHNQLEAAKEVISRDPNQYPLSELYIKREVTDIDDFKLEDFELRNYQSYPAIKVEVAV